MSRSRGTRSSLVAALLAGILWAGAAFVPPAAAPLVATTPVAPILAALDAPAALAADDLTVSTKARYVVQPDDGVIRVTVDLTILNQKPNRVAGGVITRYFYDGVNLGVQTEATRLRATQDGAALRVTSAKRRGYRLVTIQLRQDLYFQQAARVRLAFDLPAGDPRSASDVRVGPAFATFLAWAFGDTGSVRVEVPRAFDVDISGDDMATQPGTAETQVFTASTSDALDWFAWVNARNDDGLTRQHLDLADGERIVVRGWPEDARWRRRVQAILGDSVPDLVRRIGLPWPVDGPLNVLEVHTPLLEGYGGFYDPDSDEITISEDLDVVTIVHEASHAWFNTNLFTERWINEGLAEEYASRVLGGQARGAAGPRKVDRSAKVAFPLEAWTPPSPIRDPQSDARERYGYAAAWTVIRAIVKDAGEDGMREVFRAAADGTTAYVGSGDPEPTALPNDWRRLLDLAEELGGAENVDEELATWALAPDEAGQLPARDAARDAYRRLVAEGDGWAAPPVVRLALDGWRFADAEARIADAQGLLDERAAIVARAAADGLTPTDDLEGAYEAADSTAALAAAATLAAETSAALGHLEAATTAAAAPRDWLVSLGLSGKDPDADLAAARAAWESGDNAAATDRATLVSGTLAVAVEAGRGRAMIIGGGLVLIVLLFAILALAWWRRLRRQRRFAMAVAASEAAATAGWTAVEPATTGEPATIALDEPATTASGQFPMAAPDEPATTASGEPATSEPGEPPAAAPGMPPADAAPGPAEPPAPPA